MIGLALLFQAAAAAPTVGDTIWVARTVQVAPRQTVRPVDWDPPDPIEAVGRPQVTVRGGSAEIRYPVTVWRAGQYRVAIPGPLLLGPEAAADSLPPYVVTLTVTSVLPAEPVDSPIAPQPRAALVVRRTVSPLPLVILWAAAVALLLPLRWWWWRRGKPPASARPEGRLDVPVDRWASAGERRVVASLAAMRLRATASGKPALDAGTDAELREVLAALDRTRFGAGAEEDALTLLRRAARLEDRLAREPV